MWFRTCFMLSRARSRACIQNVAIAPNLVVLKMSNCSLIGNVPEQVPLCLLPCASMHVWFSALPTNVLLLLLLLMLLVPEHELFVFGPCAMKRTVALSGVG